MSATKITERQLSISDNTTGDVSTSAHGFVPKAPNDTSQWLRGDGSFATVPGRLLSISVLTSTSSSTYTTPAGCNKIFVRMVGGGAGGGGADGGSSQAGVGGGGGAGGYLEKLIAVSPSTGYTYQCGALGNGGTAGNNQGSAGSDTTLYIGATTLTAKGGLSGGGSMSAGTTVAVATAGSGSALPTNGDVNIQGQLGHHGYRLSGTQVIAGKGGDTIFGRGGYGATSMQGAGAAAGGYGAGGGGAASTTTTDTAGGNGSPGLIIIMEYA